MTKVDSLSLRSDLRSEAPCSCAAPSRRGRVFAEILRAAGAVAASAIPVVGPVVAGAIPAIGRRPAAGDLPPGGDSDALRLIELQRAINRETQYYETTSNIMKARHDAAMNSIRNLRS